MIKRLIDRSWREIRDKDGYQAATVQGMLMAGDSVPSLLEELGADGAKRR